MSPSDVVLVRFPFSSLSGEKKRPALVLSVAPYSSKLKLITIAMITSKIEGIKLRGDVSLKDWNKSGLLHPSIVRVAKVATLEEELISKKLGKLTSADIKEVRKKFQEIFGFWLS